LPATGRKTASSFRPSRSASLLSKQRRQRQEIFDVEDNVAAKRNKLIDALQKRKNGVASLFTPARHMPKNNEATPISAPLSRSRRHSLGGGFVHANRQDH
jgi:hypothetical protein